MPTNSLLMCDIRPTPPFPADGKAATHPFWSKLEWKIFPEMSWRYRSVECFCIDVFVQNIVLVKMVDTALLHFKLIQSTLLE